MITQKLTRARRRAILLQAQHHALTTRNHEEARRLFALVGISYVSPEEHAAFMASGPITN